jgi:hypothetical protein
VDWWASGMGGGRNEWTSGLVGEWDGEETRGVRGKVQRWKGGKEKSRGRGDWWTSGMGGRQK